jgi:hypothetical protein
MGDYEAMLAELSPTELVFELEENAGAAAVGEVGAYERVRLARRELVRRIREMQK